MDFDFSFGNSGAARPEGEEPFRILVLGGFSGQGGLPLAERKPIRIDIDNFDGVLARLAPRLTIDVGGASVALGFSCLDDFHPDDLYARVELFAGLRGLRQELRDPALFERAAAALGTTPVVEAPAEASADEGAADIERLLGRKPSAPPEPRPAAAGGIDELVRRIVAPHVVHDNPQQQQYLAAADEAIAEHMRGVLHHPQFQALEALWRSVETMVRELAGDGTLEIHLMDYSRDALLEDIAAHADDMSRSLIQQVVCGGDDLGAEGRRWSLLASDQSFGPEADEMALLTLLGAIATKAGAPLLAAARPQLLGCDSVAQLLVPSQWPEADDVAFSAWNALRSSGVAGFVGLVLPGVLQRLPYGAATDPVSAFAFEEMAGGRSHQRYLWGPPALALATLCGRAFEAAGWQMAPDDECDLEDLPSHVYREDGEVLQQPCAEVAMGEAAGSAILARGVMPLLSYRNRNAARLLRWQSIAAPARSLSGRWLAR